MVGPRISQNIASPLWLVFKVVRPFYRRLRFYYECRVAPFIARNMPWLLYPFYRVIRAMNICFVVNVADGTGHILPELDNFFRKLSLGEIDSNKRYIFVRKESPFSTACVHYYRDKFWWAICSDFTYHLTLPITIRYKDIILDSGISRLKWQLDSNGNYIVPSDGQTYLHRINKKESTKRMFDMFARRAKTEGYYPLKEADFDSAEVNGFLKGNTGKLALVHIKTNVMNATAKPTEPFTYLDALAYLSELGFRLVFVGREKMPAVFKEFGVVNYSESPIASFKNDLALFNVSEITITGAGGIAYLAAYLDKPNLYLNSWHIKSAGLSRRSICVPALVRRKGGDEYIKYPAQNELYLEATYIECPEVFPEDRFEARNASVDEILEATKELIALTKKNDLEWTPIQKRFGELINTDMRMSDYFLKKWGSLFP